MILIRVVLRANSARLPILRVGENVRGGSATLKRDRSGEAKSSALPPAYALYLYQRKRERESGRARSPCSFFLHKGIIRGNGGAGGGCRQRRQGKTTAVRKGPRREARGDDPGKQTETRATCRDVIAAASRLRMELLSGKRILCVYSAFSSYVSPPTLHRRHSPKAPVVPTRNSSDRADSKSALRFSRRATKGTDWDRSVEYFRS